MNSKLKINYHVDKLVLVLKTPTDFQARISQADPFILDLVGIPNVFICTKQVYAVKYVVPRYTLEYMDDKGIKFKIGVFKPDIEQSITLTVDNRLLYSDRLGLLYLMEEYFNLEFVKIAQLEIACDANQNLPRKLNDVMHQPNCTLTRRGAKLPMTEKGNQILGIKISQNIKAISCRENPTQSYYYEIKPSGSRTPVVYRCYNKGKEISEKSHKEYIEESNGFGSSIYRLEVSTHSYDLKRQEKNKSGVTMKSIYRHIGDAAFLRTLFITYINRLATLNIDSKRIKISEYLRLE